MPLPLVDRTTDGTPRSFLGRRSSEPESLDPVPVWQRALSHRVVRDLAGAATVAIVVGLAGNGQSSRRRLAMLAFVLSLTGSLLAHRRLVAAALLPLMRRMFDVVGPLLGLFGLQLILFLAGYDLVAPSALIVAPLAVCGVVLPIRLALDQATPPRIRTLIVGAGSTADRIARQLRRHAMDRFDVIGWLGSAPDSAPLAPRSRLLGPTEDLSAVVARHRVDIVVVDDDLTLDPLLDELAAARLEAPVEVLDLTGFSEKVFGHVPLSSLDVAWFRFVLDPGFRRPSGGAKRALDLAVSVPVAMLAAPLLLVLALLVRRDGGPSLFRQSRIGLGGRPFELYKLRSMKVQTEIETRWSSQDDDRVTSIGRFLRRTHLDELPQLLNVLRGDMSLVGPRPEQPAMVDRLGAVLPYYERRHAVRPGITGWAQVRCGYAGTDVGSAWKLSHDLYYLKHRSLALDLLILSETLRTLVADRQYGIEPAEVAELVGTD